VFEALQPSFFVFGHIKLDLPFFVAVGCVVYHSTSFGGHIHGASSF
jgi:hypothetical protein